jgi:hypothetical protein
MNKDLFLAILAMDSYNREYGAGVNLTGSTIGQASILTRASLGIDDTEYAAWQSTGFYAIAYDVSNVAGFGTAGKVISLSGTERHGTVRMVEARAGIEPACADLQSAT